MEQLDYLWSYQELDLKMDKLTSRKKASNARKKLYRSIKYLKSQQEALIKLNNDFGKKNHIYNRIYHEFESLDKSLKEEETALSEGDIKSFKQLDQIEQRIDEAQGKLNEKRQEIISLLKDIDNLNKKLQGVSHRLRKGKKKYDENKNEYDLEMKELDSQLAGISKQREEIKKKLDASLHRKYQAVKGNHTTAMAEIKGNRCGGCNMGLASLVVQNIKSKSSIMECENCGRILYSGSDPSND